MRGKCALPFRDFYHLISLISSQSQNIMPKSISNPFLLSKENDQRVKKRRKRESEGEREGRPPLGKKKSRGNTFRPPTGRWPVIVRVCDQRTLLVSTWTRCTAVPLFGRPHVVLLAPPPPRSHSQGRLHVALLAPPTPLTVPLLGPPSCGPLSAPCPLPPPPCSLPPAVALSVAFPRLLLRSSLVYCCGRLEGSPASIAGTGRGCVCLAVGGASSGLPCMCFC